MFGHVLLSSHLSTIKGHYHTYAAKFKLACLNHEAYAQLVTQNILWY